MADYITCSIHIGGTLPAAKARELEALLATYTEHSLEPGQSAFAQGEAAGGSPDDLIGFCLENGLAYWRHHDGKYDVDPYIHVYDPATGVEDGCHATGDYVPLISATDLQKYGSVADAMAYLDRFIERIPPLTVT